MQSFLAPARRPGNARGLIGVDFVGLGVSDWPYYNEDEDGDRVAEAHSCAKFGYRTVRAALFAQNRKRRMTRAGPWVYLARKNNYELRVGPQEAALYPSQVVADTQMIWGYFKLRLDRPYTCEPGSLKRKWALRIEKVAHYRGKTRRTVFNYDTRALTILNGHDAWIHGGPLMRLTATFPYC